MSAFGDAIARDILGVFLNVEEFGERIVFDGHEVTAVLQQNLDVPSQAKPAESDSVTVFLRTQDIQDGIRPGRNVTMDHRNYRVASRSDDVGVTCLVLSRTRGS